MIRGRIIAHFQAVPFWGPVSDVLHRTSEKHPECSKFCSVSRNSWSKYYNTHIYIYIYMSPLRFSPQKQSNEYISLSIYIYMYIHISYIHENIMKTKYCKLIEQEIHWNTSVPWAPLLRTRIRHHHNEVNQKPRHHVADLSDQIAGITRRELVQWMGANSCDHRWSTRWST